MPVQPFKQIQKSSANTFQIDTRHSRSFALNVSFYNICCSSIDFEDWVYKILKILKQILECRARHQKRFNVSEIGKVDLISIPF